MRRDTKPYDVTTKYLLEADPAGWLDWAGLGRHSSVSIVDADLATVTSAADKVIRVTGPASWLAHFELQASRDPSLPHRILRYSVLLTHRHGIPVRSIAILLRPEADHPQLTGSLLQHHITGENYLRFEYEVLRVWQEPVDRLLAGGLGTLPLAPISSVAPAALPDVIREMERRISAEAAPAEAANLWTSAYILMGLRYPPEVTASLIQGVRAMEESLTYQAILEEGRQRGRAEGKAEGKAEEARMILLAVARKRFGPPSSRIEQWLDGRNAEQLERLVERVLDVESWDELLS